MTKFLDHIAIKEKSGSISDDIPIGVPFDRVYLTDADGATINLQQFYNNYIKYMNETAFVHSGNVEPNNHHIKIWIDQDSSNQDDIPITFNTSTPDSSILEQEYYSKELRTLVGSDYSVEYNSGNNVITIKGLIRYFDTWNAYPNEIKEPHYAIVLPLTSNDGYILKTRYLDTPSFRELIFGQTDDGPGTINLILAIEKNTQPQLIVYRTAADAAASNEGLIITIDLSQATFENITPSFSSVKVADRTHSWQDKSYNDLYGTNFKAELSGNNINLSGDLYQVERWPGEPSAVNKYCGVINLTGYPDYILDKGGHDDPYYWEEADDMILVFTKESKTKDWVLYRTEDNFDTQTNGTPYHISAEACNFLWFPAIVNAEAVPQTKSIEGVTCDKLMSSDFKADLNASTNTIKCSGTIYKYNNWAAFGQSLRNKNYIVLNIAVNYESVVTVSQEIDGQDMVNTFTDLTKDWIIPLDKDHKTYQIICYPNQAAKESNSAATIYTIDCTECTFSDEEKPA